MKRQLSEENAQDKDEEAQTMESAEDKLQMVDSVLMSEYNMIEISSFYDRLYLYLLSQAQNTHYFS